MNRNSKRRRSSSEFEDTSECDYVHDEKKLRYEENVESQSSSACDTFDQNCQLNKDSEASSRLFNSDLADHAYASSECEYGDYNPELGSLNDSFSSNTFFKHDCVSSEAENALQALESEDDEPKELHNFTLSPNSNNDYSSCDERVIASEVISSPVAGSIIDSDYEDLYSSNCSKEKKINNASNSVLSFMGQLTPGSSVSKVKSCSVGCETWTRKISTESKAECPLPNLAWANREKFWEVICHKDELSLKNRNTDLFDYQQYLRPRMRVILLDWLSEVAEVFTLHRETYYLTIDYIDRYLSIVPNIPKQQLQLIGITCLFLASKMEEIYPPKIDQFANVTDGACTEGEIFSMEVTILKHLNWILSPITVNNWLEMMLQIMYQKIEKRNQNILLPNFSSTLFKRLCQLLDLVTLDITSLRFSYGVLAAAAIYILVDPNLALFTSGLKKEILEPCVQWMSVYWKVLRDTYTSEMVNVSDLLNDKSEIYFGEQHPELQTHSISMQLYDLAQAQFELLAHKGSSKSENLQILTPPPSSSKSASFINKGNSSC